MPSIEFKSFDCSGKTGTTGEVRRAMKAGFSTIYLPDSTGGASVSELCSMHTLDGVRLRCLQLHLDVVDAELAANLSRLASVAFDGLHLQCLCFQQCEWKHDAMIALAPAMIEKGGAPRLTSLHLHHARTIPIESIELLRDVLVDSNCSIVSLCMEGTLGWLVDSVSPA